MPWAVLTLRLMALIAFGAAALADKKAGYRLLAIGLFLWYGAALGESLIPA